MNLLKTYVTNITHIGEPNEYGFCKVTADYDCYGIKEEQTTEIIHKDDVEQIKKDGYYLS